MAAPSSSTSALSSAATTTAWPALTTTAPLTATRATSAVAVSLFSGERAVIALHGIPTASATSALPPLPRPPLVVEDWRRTHEGNVLAASGARITGISRVATTALSATHEYTSEAAAGGAGGALSEERMVPTWDPTTGEYGLTAVSAVELPRATERIHAAGGANSTRVSRLLAGMTLASTEHATGGAGRAPPEERIVPTWDPTTGEYGFTAASAAGATETRAAAATTSSAAPADPTRLAFTGRAEADAILKATAARIASGRPTPGQVLSADSFSRAALGVGFNEPVLHRLSAPTAPPIADRPLTKTIPPFRERGAEEPEEAYARAKAAYDSVRSSKPLCTAPDFGKGALILNSKQNLPLYFHRTQAELRSCVKDVLVYMALLGNVDDVTAEGSIAAAREIFPDIEATVTHLMPTVEGLLSKGMCFGFAMAFAAYLSQEKDLKKTEEGFTSAFIALQFDHLAPVIQLLYMIHPSVIQSALVGEDRVRYETKLNASKPKPSISRKLVFIEAPPHTTIRYSGSRASILAFIERHIEESKKVPVNIIYTCNIFPEPAEEISFLEAQVLRLMRKYRNHPAVFCFETHTLCFYTTDEGLYLLDDGNKGCKIFSSEKEAVEAIAKHVLSYGKDKVLDCHVFLKKDT